jgi:hypothetical protein
MPPPTTTLILVALLPLVAWRAYARIRRLVGRQRLSKIRPWVTLAVFPLIIALLALGAHAHPERLIWLAAGLLLGAGLGRFGLAKTTFEATPQGLFYTPNAHLGIALSTLFLARIVYRFVELYALGPAAGKGADDFASSWLTLAVFGLLSGYYMSYALGLVRWRFCVLRARRERERKAAP